MEDDVMYLFLIKTKVWKYSGRGCVESNNGFELVMILNIVSFMFLSFLSSS